MQETLVKEGEYALTLEKVRGEWWLELRHLPSGNTRILYCKRKANALALFKGMNMPEIVRAYAKINPPSVKMYKEQRRG